jgi:hypothetical protein
MRRRIVTVEGVASLNAKRYKVGLPNPPATGLKPRPPKRIISDEDTAVMAAPERGPGEWLMEPFVFSSRS